MTQDKSSHTYWNSQQLHPDVVAVFSSSQPLPTTTLNAPTAILLPQQTHTTNAHWVTPNITPHNINLNPSPLFPDTDALITDIKGLTIGVRTADCVPILLYAADIHAVAAIHAGWKGTLHGIVDNVIDMLIDKGCNPSAIHACFGPSICPQCYEVDDSLAQQFINAGYADCVINDCTIDPLTSKHFAQSKPHIDLIKVNINRLTAKGISPTNISPYSPCTRHHRSEHNNSNITTKNICHPQVDENHHLQVADKNICHPQVNENHHLQVADKNICHPQVDENHHLQVADKNICHPQVDENHHLQVADKNRFTFHSWRRNPATPHRLITAITLM